MFESDNRACKDADTSVFFPNPKNTMEERIVIRSYCNNCGVKDECLEYAIEHNEQYGIWGGMGEKERSRFRKKLKKVA